MKKICLFIMFIILCAASSCVYAMADEETVSAMTQFNTVVAEIKKLPDVIDHDICAKNWDGYRSNMTLLAQKIIEANTLIKDVQLYYPIDLWIIYNRISANPICGIGKRAMDAMNVAEVSRISNEEKMGILENSDVCMCWNIATGRDEPTGYYKDGACRCTYGTKAYDPNIGINSEP